MNLKLLGDLWVDSQAAGLDEPELLAYRSRLLGADKRLTNYGGGNTSAKVRQTDPVTGDEVEVLWVKGSGGDLGTITRGGFATLYLDRFRALKRQYRGVEHEDEMPALFPLCTFGANPRAASIDTPLHAFVPFRHVDHLHPDWAIALAASANGPAHVERIRERLGIDLLWLPWKRPGFELGLWLEKALQERPDADGILLASHGIFTWGGTSRESYLNTLRVIDGIGQYVMEHVERTGPRLFGGTAVPAREDRRDLAAAVLPVLRGQVGDALGHFDDSPEVLRFVGSLRARDLAWQGTSCPDHFVRTKVRPLFVEWDGSGGVEGLARAAGTGFPAYREAYRAYYEAHRRPDSPAMRSASPTVVLVPGVGMFSFGRSKPEARITGEFYINAIHVMEGATALADPDLPTIPGAAAVDNYVALPPAEAFGIEYWLLEEAKLRRLPPEGELSRKVAVVIGASPGIGTAAARRLAREGAHVVVGDRRADAAEEAAKCLRGAFGAESAVSATVDATNRESVRALLRVAVEAFGGIDILVQTAAVFFPPDSRGRISDDQWRATLDVNLLGSVIAAEEAAEVMRAQGTPGSIVLLSSANAVVPKRGSLAYDSGKAALNHAIRELALECAPSIRVNGVAPASVVEGSIQFPRDRVISSLRKYGLAFDEEESTEARRERLSDYYSGRTLLKRRVGPEDVAEAVFLLASGRLGATTGQILAVDAGLPEAFLR